MVSQRDLKMRVCREAINAGTAKRRCPAHVEGGPGGRGRPCNRVAEHEVEISPPGSPNPHRVHYCAAHAQSSGESNAKYWAEERAKDEADAAARADRGRKAARAAALADCAAAGQELSPECVRELGALVIELFYEDDDEGVPAEDARVPTIRDPGGAVDEASGQVISDADPGL